MTHPCLYIPKAARTRCWKKTTAGHLNLLPAASSPSMREQIETYTYCSYKGAHGDVSAATGTCFSDEHCCPSACSISAGAASVLGNGGGGTLGVTWGPAMPPVLGGVAVASS